MKIYGALLVFIACGISVTSGQLIPDFCGPPRCKTVQDIQTLQIAENRRYFYQCSRNEFGVYAPLLRPCGAGTVFSFYHQVCVFDFMWKDVCKGITTTTSPITPAPTTTTSPITPAPTTTTSLPITTPVTTTTSQLTSTTTTLLPITTPVTTTTSQLTSTTTTSLPLTTPVTTTTSQLTSTTTTSLPITTTTIVTTIRPPLQICSRPQCTTALELILQHPSELADAFYLCTRTPQGTYEANMLFCEFGSLFSFEQQACVPPEQWVNACNQSWAPTCQPVLCNNTLRFIILHPSADREHFFQCINQGAMAQLRQCEPGTWFGFRQQACVQPEQYINDCQWQ